MSAANKDILNFKQHEHRITMWIVAFTHQTHKTFYDVTRPTLNCSNNSLSAECRYGWFGFCSCNPSRVPYSLLSKDTVLSPVSTPQCAEPAQSALIPVFWKLQHEIPCWYDAGCCCSHMANVQSYGHKCIYSLRKRERAIDLTMEKYARCKNRN